MSIPIEVWRAKHGTEVELEGHSGMTMDTTNLGNVCARSGLEGLGTFRVEGGHRSPKWHKDGFMTPPDTDEQHWPCAMRLRRTFHVKSNFDPWEDAEDRQ